MTTPLMTLVEDDPAIVRLLEALLADEGYQTSCWPQGAGAFAAIRRNRPDLLIRDPWLQRRDAGWQIHAQLRRDPATVHLPVIVCSGDTGSAAAQEALRWIQPYAVLEKPFDVDDLLTTITQLLAWRPPNRVGTVLVLPLPDPPADGPGAPRAEQQR